MFYKTKSFGGRKNCNEAPPYSFVWIIGFFIGFPAAGGDFLNDTGSRLPVFLGLAAGRMVSSAGNGSAL